MTYVLEVGGNLFFRGPNLIQAQKILKLFHALKSFLEKREESKL